MLLTAMLLMAQDPETAIDAERAFNRAAQIEGQWTAFRKFSTPDALLFTPQPAKAHEILPEKNPPIAVQWWPAESYVSCDGTVAVNTGPWVRPNGVGYFTTVWVRQSDGHYKWVYDGGDVLETPRALPEKPKIFRPKCSKPWMSPVMSSLHDGEKAGGGMSDDKTLSWSWVTQADGARKFTVEFWTGEGYETVLTDKVAVPK